MATIGPSGSSLENWLEWNIRLMARGLRPVDSIKVHGPHPPWPSYVWGRADCELMGTSTVETVRFCTNSDVESAYDLRSLRVFSPTTGVEFEILPRSDLPNGWQEDMATFSAERAMLRRQSWKDWAGRAWTVGDSARITVKGR